MAGRDNAEWNNILATLEGAANRCARPAPPLLGSLVRFVLCSTSRLSQRGVRVNLGRHRPGGDLERAGADVSRFSSIKLDCYHSRDDFALAATGKLAPPASLHFTAPFRRISCGT